eukprot:COSAG01_NODE_363_length_18113_cov_45.041690_1_plen_291_part_00
MAAAPGAPVPPVPPRYAALPSWSCKDVAAWVRQSLALPQYADAFLASRVDGELLPLLTDADLRNDLVRPGPRWWRCPPPCVPVRCASTSSELPPPPLPPPLSLPSWLLCCVAWWLCCRRVTWQGVGVAAHRARLSAEVGRLVAAAEASARESAPRAAEAAAAAAWVCCETDTGVAFWVNRAPELSSGGGVRRATACYVRPQAVATDQDGWVRRESPRGPRLFSRPPCHSLAAVPRRGRWCGLRRARVLCAVMDGAAPAARRRAHGRAGERGALVEAQRRPEGGCGVRCVL